jgi:peroxiredoxin
MSSKGEKVIFLADGSANFAKKIGLVMDLTEKGMGGNPSCAILFISPIQYAVNDIVC